MRNFFFILIICILFFSGCTIPNMMDLELNNESELYSGYKDLCENAYIKIDCEEGLECKTITTKPYVTKVCLNPGEEIPEDLVYKNPYDNNKTYIYSKDIKPQNTTNSSQ